MPKTLLKTPLKAALLSALAATALLALPACKPQAQNQQAAHFNASDITGINYAQGFALYQSASKEYGWHLDFARIAAIFRSGCIIQAEFLNKITEAYMREPSLDNLMFNQFFLDKINEGQQFLRDTACLAIQQGIAVPAFANALQYIDAYRCGAIGANLIQAQRDYFGAHTFKRIDVDGVFHHEWSQHFSY